jgi:hypothetical protein
MEMRNCKKIQSDPVGLSVAMSKNLFAELRKR